MGSTFGKAIKISLFGESHGPSVGVVIDGLAPGLKVDEDFIAAQMHRRRGIPGLSTKRNEADKVEFLSGVKDGFTEGTPLAIIVRNLDARPGDYEEIKDIPRPSHADYTAKAKYLGFADLSGGGHFSGRLSAPLVAAGAILMQALEAKGIKISTEITRLGGCDLSDENCSPENRNSKIESIVKAAMDGGDSVGGVLETVVTGLDAGFGEPWFDTIEGELSHAIFSIPAVKGIEFGAGFGIADMPGSLANDEFEVTEGKVFTKTNNSGGIQGGISNGMPIVFRSAVKPTPSIAKKQQSVDLKTMESVELEISGRHDAAVVLRVPAVIDALTALVVADLIARRFGYMELLNN